MIIKRAFYVMLVLMLMPLTALSEEEIFVPEPATGTAVIAVNKFFNNSALDRLVGEPVTVRIQCDGGSIAPSSAIEVFPRLGKYETSFVIFNLGPGQTTECTVWEEPIDGYTPKYFCDGYDGASPDPSCDPGFPGIPTGPSKIACQFNEMRANLEVALGDPTPGSQASCVIRNKVDPVAIYITKTWEVFGHAGDDFSQATTLGILCDARIVGGHEIAGGYRKWEEIGDSDYVDGMASVSVLVLPEWYPEIGGKTRTTECFVEERNVDSAVEVDASDCEYLSIPIGGDQVDCTITNTMFFEGIPTLNQYGMAIMALLMLGVGFIGFRRFV
jgi:hypothetical protein